MLEVRRAVAQLLLVNRAGMDLNLTEGFSYPSVISQKIFSLILAEKHALEKAQRKKTLG